MKLVQSVLLSSIFACGVLFATAASAETIEEAGLGNRPIYTICRAKNFIGVTFRATGYAYDQADEDGIQEKALDQCRVASRWPNTCRPAGCDHRPF